MEAAGRKSESKYNCLIFDMDDTLYPLSVGINIACGRYLEDFMLNKLRIEQTEVPKMCLDLYSKYGTVMAVGYEFDNDEFNASLNATLPYNNLKPDPVLRNLLLSMPQRKIIFTNGDKGHVDKVLSRLGLEGCFESIICFETLNPPAQQAVSKDSSGTILCKPSVEAFEVAVKLANVDPTMTMFFDDSVRNIESAKAIKLNTVIVGRSVVVPGADYAVSTIHDVKEAIPEIWEGQRAA